MKVTTSHSHNWKLLTPRQSEQRRQELETCLLHLIDQDNGPQDRDGRSYEFDLQQRSLGADASEQVQQVQGRAEGEMLQGSAEFVRRQISPFDAGPDDHWNIVYQADSITCHRSRGTRGTSQYYTSHEFISRDPAVDSYQMEWKLAETD